MDKNEIRKMAANTKGYRTDREIANALGMDNSTLSRKLSGQVRFSARDLDAAMEAFGITKGKAAKLFL